MKKYFKPVIDDLKVAFGGGNGVNASGDGVLDYRGYSKGDDDFMPEESHSLCDGRRYFTNTQYDEIKPVIVSESETIKPIANQKQLQGVDMRSNSSPQRGEEAFLSEQTRTLGVQVRGEINSHTERKRKYLVTNTTMTKNFSNNAILRGLNNCSPQEDSKNSCRLMRGEVNNENRKVAFTLAEVLITLGIIGVVATLTLPSLIQRNVEKQRVAQLKKAFAELSQAYNLAVEEYGAPTEWGMGGMYEEQSHYIMANNFKKYLKISVDCTDMSKEQALKICGHNAKLGKVRVNDAIYINSEPKNGKGVILSDGTTVTFRVYSGTCNHQYEAVQNVCGNITVDVNGSNYPNQTGEDQFSIFFTKDKLIPAGIQGATLTFERACNRSVKSPYPGYDGGANMYACTAWVLYNENQDYLHCDDLSWTGKKTCKDK